MTSRPVEAWLRSGAKEGDAIVITGAVGGSILRRHLRPEARIDTAIWLRQTVQIHAAIDISDGLSLDLDRLCAASGLGAELEMERMPIHDDAIILAQQTGRTPMEHAWSDGEDFELILTMSPSDADDDLLGERFGRAPGVSDTNRSDHRSHRLVEKGPRKNATARAAGIPALIVVSTMLRSSRWHHAAAFDAAKASLAAGSRHYVQRGLARQEGKNSGITADRLRHPAGNILRQPFASGESPLHRKNRLHLNSGQL